jgi:uncharacterized protein (TIGR00106 family)
MKVIADFSVVPIGVGVSVSKYVAACQRVLDEMKLKTHLHAYGTNVEGEWDEVFAAITDRDQSMSDKVTSVASKLGDPA